MERRRLVLLLSTVASLQVSNSASSGNIPSRFWCFSEEIALQCGVTEQCKKERPAQKNAAIVNIGLYYESMCGGCQEFFTTQLYPTFQKLSSIMNVTLVPYGNTEETKVGDHWEFDCQHGPDECLGDIIETCTIAIVKTLANYIPFINCVEGSKVTPKEAAEKCAPQFSIPLDQVLNCTTSDYGNQLQHQMAVLTDSLVPQHNYVPWITLNGLHTDDIEEKATTNLLKLVCDTYPGEKPPACNSG
ncbi:unnamed protein product [Candidula unifasciata]|uniref:Gamma-interferon-inducible lysosomal thiol reductase n=1 Tax=Candidula unifasciata TaxID=100452 RepID=A0A8S3ZTY9_9EUPU|nr:unnamed protein product [Candidula unifasciata]